MSLPYVQGSDTSEAAAKAAAPKRQRHEERVYAFIESCGDRGATDAEIETALGLPHQTASARRVGLVQKGRVKDSGLRRPTPSGRDAAAWIVGRDEYPNEGSPNNRTTRPTVESLKIAIKNIKQLCEHSRATGGPPISDDLQKLGKWLLGVL